MIVAFGDAVVDFFAMPRGTSVARAESFRALQGGAPANVAVVAARLGAPARFVGAVGRDAHGDRMVAALQEAGVDARAVVRLAARTSVTFVHITPTGERSFLSYREGSADTLVTPEHLAALPTEPLSGARVLHLSSGSLLTEPVATTTRALVAEARGRGVPVSVDLNVRGHLWRDRDRMAREVAWLCAQASVLKASDEDLATIGVAAEITALRSLAPHALTVLTLAERGAHAWVHGAAIEVPAPRVDALDSTGAGDAFMATLLAALAGRGRTFAPDELHRDEVRAVLAVACAVGARATTAVGATEGVRELSAERALLLQAMPPGC